MFATHLPHESWMADAVLLKNVRPRGGEAVDVLIEEGRFQRFGKNLGAADAATIDGRGLLMLPGLIESHVHLDKTLWGLPWRPNSAGPRLVDRIEDERQIRRSLNVSVEERGGNLLRQCIARGSTIVRSYIDIDPETGLKGVNALLALREQYAGSVDLQLVAFPQQGILISPGTAELMEEAIKFGVDAVGGLDPAGSTAIPSAICASSSASPSVMAVAWISIFMMAASLVPGRSSASPNSPRPAVLPGG
jgi:cytosine deaminase